MKTAMELIEILKQFDPMTPVVIEDYDMEVGYHFEPVKGDVRIQSIRSTNIKAVDSFDGTHFTTKAFLSCPIEKPNAFEAIVLK